MGQLIYTSANQIREQSKVDAARITQKSGNELRGAKAALMQFNQSLANQRSMESAGEQHATIVENLARNLDAAARGTISSRISAADEAGAYTAFALASGVGGGTVDSYNETMRLAQASNDEVAARGIETPRTAAQVAHGAA